MSLYDQYICENDENQCYYVKPFAKTSFGGINPNTGKSFTEDEIGNISKHLFNTCASKNGSVNYCCDPFDSETNIPISDELNAKYPYIKVNRQNNKINTIDVCTEDDSSKCDGGEEEWEKPKSYHICKMEGGSRIQGENKVDTIVNLQKDCYSAHCNPQEPEISLANFIGDIADTTTYPYYDHVNIAEAIKNDSVPALIDEYMAKVKNINDILIHNDRGETMLHVAVRNGASKVVAFLVGRGADLNVQNIVGDTPLHLGARYNKSNIVYALLNYGANINIVNNNNEVPLNDAVKDGSIEMLRILAHNGGNIYHINKDGDNLLHIAIQYAVKDKGAKVKFLVERGVSITHENNKKQNPINTTEQMLEEMKQDKNSDIILEGFSCLTGFKKYERYYNEEIPEILTYLQKISYQQNKSKYQDYIIGELPNSSYVEFNYGVCVGGNDKGISQTKKECKQADGNWVSYKPKELDNKELSHDYYYNTSKTKINIEYPSDNEILIDKINNNDLYRDKCNKPILVKPLPHMTGEIDLGLNNNNINNDINHKTNNNNSINNPVNNPVNNSINNSINNSVNNSIKNNNSPIIEGFGNISTSYCNMAMISFILFVIVLSMQTNKK